MTQPFMGEIRMFATNYVPKGWAMCNGQLLPINQNQALFSILGTYYGGDGITTFALPDLRGRHPVHTGPSNVLGQKGGAVTASLTLAHLPVHTHVPRAAATGDAHAPTGNVWASLAGAYAPAADTTMAAACVSVVTGGGQPHDNVAPYVVVTFGIALTGLFPSPA
ncbi:phage tail protein [Dactylosporangium sp. CS-047395]|uniref:phage tail protein n=1 Tax=Dactylosporangium sp. CS-047395 TaxID=3239936 RepID=UPI003D9393C5